MSSTPPNGDTPMSSTSGSSLVCTRRAHTEQNASRRAHKSDGEAVEDEFTRPPLLEGRAAHNRRLPTSRTGLSENNVSSRTKDKK